ncbi:riboflavin synthase [uncultured Sphingomonas sp.]|uniref:riboflavin synthase n=1 Tax=uncultured Sphingomonas sp. TaxID=158754 RepID=UPI0035CADCC3
MFTGIISDIGTIVEVEERGDLRVVIATGHDTATLDLGASIACSGVCLTAVDRAPGRFAVDVSAETISRTAAGQWVEGRRLNLERAMRLGDELGGHIVTGHVDGVARVTAIAPDGDSRRLTFGVAPDLAPFIAAKGSVTIDGVSLTVNMVTDGAPGTDFTVNLIPHTWQVTTLGTLGVGDPVNVEIDVLARYLDRMRMLAPTAM